MDFVENLRVLCGHYESTAQVCRKMGINRTQFNKYLNGSVHPSKANLKIICDFFGVEEFEMMMPHAQFTKEVIAKKHSSAINPYFKKMIGLHSQSKTGLERYLGWYLEYYYSLGYPGKIFCSLIEIRAAKEGVGYQRYERLIPASARHEKVTHCSYTGIAINLCDRIFLMDYETLTVNEITQTVLFPSYKSQLSQLHGVKIGVSSKSQREPACTRILYQYLGREISFKSYFRICGLYEPNEVDEKLNLAIDNRLDRDHPLFISSGE